MAARRIIVIDGPRGHAARDAAIFSRPGFARAPCRRGRGDLVALLCLAAALSIVAGVALTGAW